MDLSHVAVLQKNHTFLKENLQVDPVLDALYEKCIFTHADYDRCRQAGSEKCELVLETLKKKGVEGYKTLCAVLDTTQPFIKERLDKTSNEKGSPGLVYVNKDKLEAQYKKELVKKDGEIADLKDAKEGLEQQIEQINIDHAELKKRMEKKSDEHMTEIEKKNEEIETLKTALSTSNDELQQSQAKCENVEKTLREEQEAYDALVGVPRSQSPDRVENTEQVQHAGSTETVCQLSTESCCDESQLRLLPCLHSACKPCLDHLATQDEGTCIHCPSCGRDFTMEQTTVDHVRRNETVYSENVDGEMTCNYTKEGHSTPAVMYCHKCNVRLCSDCHKMHDKLKPNEYHRVSGINQLKNIPMKQWLRERNCRNHPDNKVQLYDHTCKKAICLVCALGAHKDHKNEDLNQAYVVAKGQLEEQVKKQQHKLKDVTDRMGSVTSHQNQLAEKQRKLKDDMTAVCKNVAAKFLHRQKQLMEELHMSLQAPNEMVEEKLDTLHDVHTSIVSAIDYTQRTLESTRREELITLTDVLQTKCDDNVKRELPEDDTQDTKILLTFQGQRALEEHIDTFGGLASSLNMDHIPDSQPTSQDLLTTIRRERETIMMHEGRLQQLRQMIHSIIPELKGSDSRMARSQEPEQLTSQEVHGIVTNLITGAFIPGETIPRGITLQGYATLYNIRQDRSVNFIICPKLQLDAGRVNTDWCHVTTDDELTNSPPATQHTDSDRLQRLIGTCSSTPIPLPPSPSSVTPVPHTTRYWENNTRVGVEVGGSGYLVLEVGVGEESQVDSRRFVCNLPRSWCVRVGSCDTHRRSLCTRVCLAGKWGECYRNTMSVTPGTQATLHYGVVLDVGRGRIGFIDVDRSVVLGKVDVEFKEDLLPVFGVCPVSGCTVNIKVVSGEEILMSDIKKSLINEVLA